MDQYSFYITLTSFSYLPIICELIGAIETCVIAEQKILSPQGRLVPFLKKSAKTSILYVFLMYIYFIFATKRNIFRNNEEMQI